MSIKYRGHSVENAEVYITSKEEKKKELWRGDYL